MNSKTCAKKKVYYSIPEVKRAARLLAKRFGYKIYYYPCDHCHWYHTSKLSPKEHQRLKHYFDVLKRSGGRV